MAEIRFEGVTKRFDDVVAVEQLNLTITDGEFMVLVGPSGCGKSTALRLIAGLERPDHGAIAIDGEIVNDVEAKRRDLAMVFQSYALYPHMTVERNIAFPLKPLGVGKPERERRASHAAEVLGLADLLDRKPAQLSGGQRQRVALARAIVREPRAFLMDEPLSNLDAKLRTETRSDLVELHDRLGATFVYVTHDQIEAMTMADRVAILHEGRLQQVGQPDDVYAEPANLFVARFIGSPPMNTWAGEIRDGLVWVQDRLAASSPGPRSDSAIPVVVGVRPEDLRFSSDGIPAKVIAVESHGHERLVTCDLLSGEPGIVRLGPKDAVPDVGEPVALRIETDEVHLFDPDSGERLP